MYALCSTPSFDVYRAICRSKRRRSSARCNARRRRIAPPDSGRLQPLPGRLLPPLGAQLLGAMDVLLAGAAAAAAGDGGAGILLAEQRPAKVAKTAAADAAADAE